MLKSTKGYWWCKNKVISVERGGDDIPYYRESMIFYTHVIEYVSKDSKVASFN